MATGRTISEVMDSMTFRELSIWMAYRARFGPLDIGRRVDHAMAVVSTTYANSKSKRRFKLTDFLPWERDNPVGPKPKDLRSMAQAVGGRVRTHGR